MRYSDSRNFKDYWVDKGLIAYTQIKTGGDAIVPWFENYFKIVNICSCMYI